jgi:hypothetical protein
MSTDIKTNIQQLKDGTFGAIKSKNADGFKTGAIIGFFSGALAGWYWRGNILTYAVVGSVIFGYVGFKINEASELKTDFSNFSKLNLNLKK